MKAMSDDGKMDKATSAHQDPGPGTGSKTKWGNRTVFYVKLRKIIRPRKTKIMRSIMPTVDGKMNHLSAGYGYRRQR
jgi:hypothetical protein